MDVSSHVETVCLLSKLKSTQHIEVEVKMDEMDLTDAEKKATYQEIKDYVLEHIQALGIGAKEFNFGNQII